MLRNMIRTLPAWGFELITFRKGKYEIDIKSFLSVNSIKI